MDGNGRRWKTMEGDERQRKDTEGPHLAPGRRSLPPNARGRRRVLQSVAARAVGAAGQLHIDEAVVVV